MARKRIIRNRNKCKVLRETEGFIAYRPLHCLHVYIEARDRKATPRTKLIPTDLFLQLSDLSNSEFDGSCVLELGVGTWRKAD